MKFIKELMFDLGITFGFRWIIVMAGRFIYDIDLANNQYLWMVTVIVGCFIAERWNFSIESKYPRKRRKPSSD